MCCLVLERILKSFLNLNSETYCYPVPFGAGEGDFR